MFKFLKHIFSRHLPLIISATFLIVVGVYYFSNYLPAQRALWPEGGQPPGTILNPDCSPTAVLGDPDYDPNCKVKLPTGIPAGGNPGDVLSKDISTGDIEWSAPDGVLTKDEGTPTTIGGIIAGYNPKDKSPKEVLEALLFPYVNPVATINNITPSFSTYELNQTIPAGDYTINFTVTKGKNIGTINLNTNIPGATINPAVISSGFPVDFSSYVSTAILTIPAGVKLATVGNLTISLSGVNTNSGVISQVTNLINWKYKVYYFTSTDGNITDGNTIRSSYNLPTNSTLLNGLGSSTNPTTFYNNFFSPSDGSYIYFVYPDVIGGSQFQLGSTGQFVPSTNPGGSGSFYLINTTNIDVEGSGISYRIYRSKQSYTTGTFFDTVKVKP